MKKLLIFALALMLVLSFAACGGGETSDNGEKPSGGISDIDGGGTAAPAPRSRDRAAPPTAAHPTLPHKAPIHERPPTLKI